MATGGDDSIALPPPPPPRPAARRDAIEMALRKFDGADQAQPAIARAPQRVNWATLHRRPGGALVTAALIAVVSVPAALLVLRDRPPTVASEAPAPSAGEPLAEQAAADEAVVADAPPEASQPPAAEAVAAAPADSPRAPAEEPSSVSESPAALAAASPPVAPPPPPPPPALARNELDAGEDSSVIVTGSRIQSPNLSKQNGAAAAADRAMVQASPLVVIDSNGAFLARLQAGLRANDRREVMRLVGLPLRVNIDGRSRIYRSSKEVEREFERIFTARVRRAVLDQRPGALSRRRAAMVGNARLWFGPSCPNPQCSPPGPILIREVNP